MTKEERYVVYNQLEILKHLNPEQMEDYEKDQRTLEIGSDSDIEEMLEFLHGTAESVKSEVYGILEMFRTINDRYDKLKTPDDGIKEYSIKFHGFDENEEFEHYAYCCYLIREMDKYNEQQGVELNSHYPHLNRYRNMLARYQEIEQSYLDNDQSIYSDLTLDDIKYIIG